MLLERSDAVASLSITASTPEYLNLLFVTGNSASAAANTTNPFSRRYSIFRKIKYFYWIREEFFFNIPFEK